MRLVLVSIMDRYSFLVGIDFRPSGRQLPLNSKSWKQLQ